jgi:hypothetical protein
MEKQRHKCKILTVDYNKTTDTLTNVAFDCSCDGINEEITIEGESFYGGYTLEELKEIAQNFNSQSLQ